jgi:hypothetical protein
MIQGGLAAGAAAWVAPVIMDSVASPAAATTVPNGCYGIQYAVNGVCISNAPTEGNCCNPDLTTGNFNTLQDFSSFTSCITTPTSCITGSTDLTFTMSNDCDCVFAKGAVQTDLTTCDNEAPGAKTITFNNVNYVTGVRSVW